jgi:hypothetical protein
MYTEAYVVDGYEEGAVAAEACIVSEFDFSKILDGCLLFIRFNRMQLFSFI